MGSGMAIFDQFNKVMRLYKYQPLIELATDKEKKEWQIRLENTLQQQLWLSPMSNFNDPFERKFKLASEPEKILSSEKLFRSAHILYNEASETHTSPDEFKQILISPDFREQLRISEQSWIDDFFCSHGVYCFTSDASNIPMWAHYANNHRGYCVVHELDFHELCENAAIPAEKKAEYQKRVLSGEEIISFHYQDKAAWFIFTKIRYSKTTPAICSENLFEIGDNQYKALKYVINNSISVKYHQWEYENEYRLIANGNSQEAGYMSLELAPFLKVTGIIMGSEITQAEKDIFYQLCKQYRCHLYQAKSSETDYEILIDLVKDFSQINGA